MSATDVVDPFGERIAEVVDAIDRLSRSAADGVVSRLALARELGISAGALSEPRSRYGLALSAAKDLGCVETVWGCRGGYRLT